MRNKNLLRQLLLFSAFGWCAAQPAMAQIPVADTLTISPDSARNRSVKLVYYNVPAHLTAASTDVVYNKDLIKSPVTNVLNALTGRLAGIYTEQFSGQPGSDGVNLSLHGRTPIVLIDGVVRNLTTLDLEEIESVTVLKDAVSTAMLGVRGANGALQITTRRGSTTQRQISFTAQTGIQQPLNLPRSLNAYDYARLRNEAIDNELRVQPLLASSLARLRFTDADLQAFQNGSDPIGHPDVDFREQILRKTSMFNRYSFNASGGNNFSRYFVALEHLRQDGLFKNSDINPYETNDFIKSYLARTNIELNITPKLSASVALLGRIINGNEPGGGAANIFTALLNTPNSAYPIYNADNSFGGSQDYQVTNLNNTALQQSGNIQGLSTGSGYRESYRRDILADFNIKRTLDEITPGLWIKGRIAYSSNLIENTTRTKVFIAYKASGSTYTPVGAAIDQNNTSSVGTQGRSNYAEGSLGYSRTFQQTHGIDVLVMVNRDNITNGSDLPYIVTGTSGRVSYNYKEKYVLEAAYGYNGSNRYPSDGATRRALFPAVGAAWNLSNENFAKSIGWMSSLKLYASYGKSGWDNPGYFAYLQRYVNGPQVSFGASGPGFTNTLTQATLAYPDITWEKANKLNVGLQGSLLKNRLGFTVEYYNNKFYDLSVQRGRNTTLLGIVYPNENIGRNRYSGMDFNLSWQETKKSFSYFIAGNASIQRSEVLYFDEAVYPNSYTNRTGNMVGRPFGLVADGLFQSDAEIAASARFNNITQPGDIKYKDLNNDGVINQLDITAIGTDKPLTTYGVNLGFSWKSFDISALVQGVANRNIFLNNNALFEFQNGGLGQAYEQNLDRWTPTNTDATYPRVGIGFNQNNQQFSSFWTRSGDYVRLKNLEIGYSLPARIISRAKLSSVRIFANGLNLLTKTKVKDIDPEIYNGAYPLQRVFNFGIKLRL